MKIDKIFFVLSTSSYPKKRSDADIILVFFCSEMDQDGLLFVDDVNFVGNRPSIPILPLPFSPNFEFSEPLFTRFRSFEREKETEGEGEDEGEYVGEVVGEVNGGGEGEGEGEIRKDNESGELINSNQNSSSHSHDMSGFIVLKDWLLRVLSSPLHNRREVNL
jgi:hypothetical protein